MRSNGAKGIGAGRGAGGGGAGKGSIQTSKQQQQQRQQQQQEGLNKTRGGDTEPYIFDPKAPEDLTLNVNTISPVGFWKEFQPILFCLAWIPSLILFFLGVLDGGLRTGILGLGTGFLFTCTVLAMVACFK
jgi:hypothetical protein